MDVTVLSCTVTGGCTISATIALTGTYTNAASALGMSTFLIPPNSSFSTGPGTCVLGNGFGARWSGATFTSTLVPGPVLYHG